nr:hypothetical protein [Desulfocurvibacter africanus]
MHIVEIDFVQLSYSNQREHLAKYMADPEKRMCANTWFREDTVDAWRHRRMYEMFDPLLTGDPGSSWLTVGDGRWGKDARYIHKKGGKVCATDITPDLLEHAKAIGFYSRIQRRKRGEALFRKWQLRLPTLQRGISPFSEAHDRTLRDAACREKGNCAHRAKR